MATATPLGVPTDVTLPAAVAQEILTLPVGATWLIIWSSTQDLWICSAAGTATAIGRFVPAASVVAGYQIHISQFGYVGIAGAAAGTARVEVR